MLPKFFTTGRYVLLTEALALKKIKSTKTLEPVDDEKSKKINNRSLLEY